MKFILTALITLAITGCGGVKSANEARQLKQNPHVQKDADALKAQAQVCVKKVNGLSKAEREKFIQCLVPPSRQQAAKSCFSTGVHKDGIPFTHRRREKFFNDLADCIAKAAR